MVFLYETVEYGGSYLKTKPPKLLHSQRLLPDNFSKPQPECIPAILREDYVEACKIRDLSPKAAATLIRRCLQGMIRDFCKISEKTLFAEIDKLRDAVNDGKAPPGVTAESVEAIDHVRTVGNIGAHMEKDIDQIVPVDAGEAQKLIELVEMLFDDWYVARERREQRLKEIKGIAAAKEAIKVANKNSTP